MTRVRFFTALFLTIPVVLLILFFPTPFFALFVLLVLVLAAREWATLLNRTHFFLRWGFVAGIVFLTWTGWVLSERHGEAVLGILLLLAAVWWLVVAFSLPFYGSGQFQSSSGHWILRMAGIFTLVPAGVTLIWMHALHPWLVLYVMLLVAFADTGAYFAGRRWGRNALAPSVSPGKTREGVFGAFLAVFVLAILTAWWLNISSLDALVFVLLSLLVMLVSVVGDLFESLLKRECGAKDSGSLLPGHGGVLDRIDSLTAAAPVFLFGLLWLELLPVVMTP